MLLGRLLPGGQLLGNRQPTDARATRGAALQWPAGVRGYYYALTSSKNFLNLLLGLYAFLIGTDFQCSPIGWLLAAALSGAAAGNLRLVLGDRGAARGRHHVIDLRAEAVVAGTPLG